jgi:hypothetical protein
MDHNLLEKYWDAETSQQEEQQLLKVMAGKTGPEAAYFDFLAKARQEKSRLTLGDIKAYNQKQTLSAAGPIVLPLYKWIATAAAVLVFVVAGLGVWKYSQASTQSTQMAETFEDPYEAYEEVREALAFVSSKLNKSQNDALVNIKKAGVYADMFK